MDTKSGIESITFNWLNKQGHDHIYCMFIKMWTTLKLFLVLHWVYYRTDRNEDENRVRDGHYRLAAYTFIDLVNIL